MKGSMHWTRQVGSTVCPIRTLFYYLNHSKISLSVQALISSTAMNLHHTDACKSNISSILREKQRWNRELVHLRNPRHTALVFPFFHFPSTNHVRVSLCICTCNWAHVNINSTQASCVFWLHFPLKWGCSYQMDTLNCVCNWLSLLHHLRGSSHPSYLFSWVECQSRAGRKESSYLRLVVETHTLDTQEVRIAEVAVASLQAPLFRRGDVFSPTQALLC